VIHELVRRKILKRYALCAFLKVTGKRIRLNATATASQPQGSSTRGSSIGKAVGMRETSLRISHLIEVLQGSSHALMMTSSDIKFCDKDSVHKYLVHYNRLSTVLHGMLHKCERY
jgi:hypothetical protein